MGCILVVDDDRAVRFLLVRLLQNEGHEVIEAENGKEAIFATKTDRPDLILLDVDMPVMDGFSALEVIREDPASARTPVVFLTGRSDRASLRRGMELGADDFITKPFKRRDVVQAIRVRLDRIEKLTARDQDDGSVLPMGVMHVLPHELNTPLTVIKSCASLLVDVELSEEQVKRLGEMIMQGSDRLHRLFQNILAFAELRLIEGDPTRLSRLKSEITDVPGVILSRVLGLKALCAKREDDVSLETIETTLWISKENFKRMAEELIDNAFKFSSPESPVSVHSFLQHEEFVLEVSDHGRGMTEEQMSQLAAFRQFDRQYYEQQGIGLGLALAKKLAEVHGGRLEITSAVGKGTTVRVFLKVRSV